MPREDAGRGDSASAPLAREHNEAGRGASSTNRESAVANHAVTRPGGVARVAQVEGGAGQAFFSGQGEQAVDASRAAGLRETDLARAQPFHGLGRVGVEALGRFVVVVVAEVRADDDGCLAPTPKQDEHLVHGRPVVVADEQGHHTRVGADLFQEGQLDFQAVLVLVRGLELAREAFLDHQRDGLAVDRHRAERCLEGAGAARRHAMKTDAMCRPDEHHAFEVLAPSREGRVGRARDGPGVDVTGVRSDHRLGRSGRGGRRGLCDERPHRRGKLLRLVGVEHACNGRRSRAHAILYRESAPRAESERRRERLHRDKHNQDSTGMCGAVVACRYFQREQDGLVVCEMCPRACRLRDGQRGVCFVRGARDGEMVLTSYGRSTGFCIDPIEKKPLHHFFPGTPVLSFGTAGCNLACKFCQNWESSRARDVQAASAVASPGAIAAAASRYGCRSVAMTYNDPVVFFEYAVDTAVACHARGIATVAVTAGYMMPAPRQEFYRHFDAANVDLKAFSQRFYRELCGGELGAVLDTLAYLAGHTEVWLEITTLLIPGENDSDKELDLMTRWLVGNVGRDVPLHFSAFHPDFRLLDRPATALAILRRARAIALGNGMRYVYTGNVRDEEGATTYCAGCGGKLIGRDGYDITSWALTENGACKACGVACAGHFAGPPGTWGNRRLSVAIAEDG